MCPQINSTKRNLKYNNREREEYTAKTREWRRNECESEPRWSPKSHKITRSDIEPMISTSDSADWNGNEIESEIESEIENVQLNCSKNDGNYSKLRAEKCPMIARLKMNDRRGRRYASKFEDSQSMNQVNLARNRNNVAEEEAELDDKLRLNDSKYEGDGHESHLLSWFDSSESCHNLMLPVNGSKETDNSESTTKQSNLMTAKMKTTTAQQPPPTSTLTTTIEMSKRRQKRTRKENLSSEFEELNTNLETKKKEKRKVVMMIRQFNSLKESSLIAAAVMFIMLIMLIILTFAATANVFTSVTATTSTSYSPKQATLVAPSSSLAAKAASKTGEKADQQPINLRRATNDEDQNKWIFPDHIIGQQQAMRQSVSPLDYVSSADLPAEFRDNSGDDSSDETTLADGQDLKEQSKLAKLCEQTSSVLASVLPAPIGSHKRSILCQFFGQIPLKSLSSNSNQAQNKHQLNNVRQYNQLQPPINPYGNMESIAVLHQAQQRPLTFHSNGKHPIQIVLEQQQRQLIAAQQAHQSNLVTNPGPLVSASYPLPIMRQMIPQAEDLKSSASIVDYSYQQKLEAPKSLRKKESSSTSKGLQMKFSTPITSSSSSFKPMQAVLGGQSSTPKPQMLISTSGWRIFNQPPQEVTSQQSIITSSKSLEENVNLSKSDEKDVQARQVISKNSTAMEPTIQSTAPNSSIQYNINKTKTTTTSPTTINTPSAFSMISKNKNKQQETLKFGSAQLLVMGRPPGFDGASLEANRSSLNKTFFSPASGSFAAAPPDTSQKRTPSIGKRSEVLKSTTRSMDSNYNFSATNLGSPSPAPDVRIIEVVAQQSNNNSLSASDQSVGGGKAESFEQNHKISLDSRATTSTTTQKPTTDLHQVQRREELVIASINNLTRIAFGNQLRDTVKVINKLIDQQADLFGKNLNRAEPLLTSESKQIVTGNKSLSSEAEINIGAKNNDKSTNKQVSHLTINKSSQTGGSIYNGKHQQDSLNNKSTRQKQNLYNSSQAFSTKPTKKPKKQVLQQAVSTTTRNRSPASSLNEIKESIKPKAATFSSQKLTTSLPSSNRGLLRSTQSRSSRNIDRLPPTKAGKSSISSSLLVANKSSNSTRDRSTSAKQTTTKQRSSSASTVSDLDSIVPTVTISDIHRDKSPWKFSPSPYIKDLTSPNTIKKSTTTLNAAFGNKLNDVKSKAPTTFPWMLPEASSNYESNLFGTTISSLRKPTTTGVTIKRWASSRKYPTSANLNKQPLVLNRLENKSSFEPKMDSLTTLKMSLTTQSSQMIASPSISTFSSSSSVPISSTSSSSSPNSQNGGSTQSRWIPTSSISARPLSLLSSTSTISTTTTPTLMPTTKAILKEATSVENDQPTTIKKQITLANSQEPINQNDLNEARASDSISKYTTHWNEANEILSTTRRFFQQPLPQIAQTGEFFNAETISTWPERYQTMLNSNSEGKTTPSFETTRRNGETYERASTNLARHRFDTTLATTTSGEQHFAASGRTTRMDPAFMIANNMSSSITILPSNHKLTTKTFIGEQNELAKQTTVANNGDQYNTYSNLGNTNEGLREGTQPEPYTQYATTDEMMITETPTVQPPPPSVKTQRKSNIPTPAVSYTLIGPYKNFKPEQKREGDVERVKFPRILDDYILPSDTNQQQQQQQHTKEDSIIPTGSANLNSGNSNSSSSISSYLKPPYLESHQKDRDHDIPTSNLSSLEKHNVSRKLYELLVPSTRNFVGPQNPLNLQRFNLSALKFLAQNILMPNRSSNNNNSTNDRGLNDHEEFDDMSNKSQEQLLNLLNPSLPMNYYDLLSNDTSQVTNRTSSGKSILGKAGNLLNDLKQLESKRAAALLAAIRYQVPSPLVRPWDTTSDNHYSNDGLPNSNERLDSLIENIGQIKGDETESESVSLRDSLLLAQLSNSIKSALFKQRIVPKNELEARLKLYNHSPVIINEDQDVILDRRSDSQAKPSKIDSFSFDQNDNFGNVSKSSAEYLYDKLPLKSGRNFTKNLLNTLLNSTSSLKIPSPFIMRANNNNTNYGFVEPIDFSAVQLEQYDDGQKLGNQSSQYPKYIRLTDNKAAWNLNYEGSLKASTRQPSLLSSAVAAKLRDSTSRNKQAVVDTTSGDVKMVPEVENKARIKEREFDCDDKQAGFYPDVDTACQTFYHCSSTGHLLTFNCPQQTRFDEKSLKCGPWFEVPCDLGRLRSIRQS